MDSNISYDTRRIKLLRSNHDVILVESRDFSTIRIRVHSEKLVRFYVDSEFDRDSDTIIEDITADLDKTLETSKDICREVAISIKKQLS